MIFTHTHTLEAPFSYHHYLQHTSLSGYLKLCFRPLKNCFMCNLIKHSFNVSHTAVTEHQDLIPDIAGKGLLATTCLAFLLPFRLCMCNLERDTWKPTFTDLFSCSSVISATLGTGRSLFSLGTWKERRRTCYVGRRRSIGELWLPIFTSSPFLFIPEDVVESQGVLDE